MGLFRRKPKDPEVERVYKDTFEKTYREERLKVAEERAKKRAKAKAHAKPFYQTLGGALNALASDFSTPTKGKSSSSILEEMAFGTPEKTKRKRKKKGKR